MRHNNTVEPLQCTIRYTGDYKCGGGSIFSYDTPVT